MKNAARTLFCLSLIFTPWSVHAQIFICKDAAGKTITSDRPIPECADRTMRELDHNGIVRREIAAPLTPEQKRQKQLQEEKRKAELAAAEEQKQNDRAILARYGKESDIEAARKRSIDLLKEQLKRESTGLAAAEKQLKDAKAEEDANKKKKMPPSANVRSRIDEATQIIESEKKIIQEREAELTNTNAKYDQTLKRYRELTATAKTK